METVKLRSVCAWCKRVMEEGDPGADVSHGICEECAQRIHRESAEIRSGVGS